MMYRSIVFLILFGSLLACDSNADTTEESEATATTVSTETELPAGFADFYERFHRDSAFQYEHIQWPLRAVPDRPLEEGEKFFFQPDTWRRQQLISPTSGYVSYFNSLTDDMVIEQIVNAQDQTGLERRFLRDADSGWKLIYYQGLRKFE